MELLHPGFGELIQLGLELGGFLRGGGEGGRDEREEEACHAGTIEVPRIYSRFVVRRVGDSQR